MMRRLFAGLTAAALVAAAPAGAATPRDMLTVAAFQTQGHAEALAEVRQAIAAAEAILAREPRDREALLQRAVGIGYRAKLTRNVADARLSRRLFEGLAAGEPRDAEVQLALAGWHLDAIADLGGFLAKVGLGAQRAAGEAALDRAVALGGNRAFMAGVAAMMRIRLDKGDVARARALAERAARGETPTPLDRLMRRDAQLLLPYLQRGDGAGAAALARAMLPFGRLAK